MKCSERAIVTVLCLSCGVHLLLSVVNFLPNVRSRGHIFSPLIMKLGQNVCLDEISYEFEIGSCWVKNRVTRSILEKPCIRSIGHIFSPIIMKLGQNVGLMKSLMILKIVHFDSKTRSLCQILEKLCVCSRGHIFSLIIMKLDQHVFLDKISQKFEYGSYWIKN